MYERTALSYLPHSFEGMWFALDDAKMSNGCLWAIPGSHLKYPIQFRFVRSADGVSTAFRKVGESEEIERPTPSFPDEEFIPLEVTKVYIIIIFIYPSIDLHIYLSLSHFSLFLSPNTSAGLFGDPPRRAGPSVVCEHIGGATSCLHFPYRRDGA